MPITENGTFDVTEKAEVNVNTPPMQWQRPKDWLPYPEMSTEYDEIWMLVHVSKEYGAARMYQNSYYDAVNNYTIDWGDGNVEEIKHKEYTNGCRPNHFYDYESLDPSSETAFGYRQCWCRGYRERGSLNQFHVGWEYINYTGLPEELTTVEIVINCGASLVTANIYSLSKANRIQHIKSIGSTLVEHGQISTLSGIQYIEGNFKPILKTGNAYANSKLFYNYIRLSFKELGITSTTNALSSSTILGAEIDCEDVDSLQGVCSSVYADEVIFKNTEKCSNFKGVLQNSRIARCKGLTFENATDISNVYGSCRIPNIDGYLNRLGEKVLLATQALYNNPWIQKCPNLIIPLCTDISSFFRGCNALVEVGTCNFSSITKATDAFLNVYYLKKINFVEESIPISLNFSKSTLLELESAKSIIKGLKNYAGTDKEFVYSIQFSAETLALLEADGETAPDGMTWRDYAMSKGWTI